MDEILLSRIFALKVQADAIDAELMAMDLQNREREKMGYVLAHGPNEFSGKSDELNGIANELNNFGRDL